MPTQPCDRCRKQNNLLVKLFEYMIDDIFDSYAYLQENYGSDHPETKAYDDLITRLAILINRTEKKVKKS